MKKRFLVPVLVLLAVLLMPCALAAEEQPEFVERTSYGMRVNADNVTLDGQLICAVYDQDGRMIGVEIVTDPSDILVYCDVNEARRVSLFNVDEAMTPTSAPVEATMAAPETPIHVHTWDSGKVTVAAACKTAGERVYTCTSASCNETPNATMSEVIPALGHSWDEGVVTVEPTADTDGSKTTTCLTCGSTKKQVLPMLDPKDVFIQVSGTPMQVQFPASACGLALPEGMRNMSTLIGTAVLTWGDTQVCSTEGRYIFYNSITDRFYFSLSFYNVRDLVSGLTGLTLTLSPAEGASFTDPIVLTNEDFAFEYTVSDQAMSQDFTSTYVETEETSGTTTRVNKRIIFSGMETPAFQYVIQYMSQHGSVQDLSLMQDPTRTYYYGGYYFDYSTYEGAPVSMYCLNAEVSGGKLILTQSKPVFPLRTGKFIGGTALNRPGTTTMSFAPTETGSIHNGLFTWTTTSEGTYTQCGLLIASDSKLMSNASSSYGMQSDGKTLQLQAFQILTRMLEGFRTSSVKPGDPLYLYYWFKDADNNMSAYAPLLTINAVQGAPINDVEGTGAYAVVHLTAENDVAYILSTPGTGNKASVTHYTGGGTFVVLVSDAAKYGTPALWTWDGTVALNSDGTYVMNLVYSPIVLP